MTKSEAATILYQAAINRNGGEDHPDIKVKAIQAMAGGDHATIRAWALGASPKGEQSSSEVAEAVKVLTQ
jgi:hypothetical protein